MIPGRGGGGVGWGVGGFRAAIAARMGGMLPVTIKRLITTTSPVHVVWCIFIFVSLCGNGDSFFFLIHT